MKYLLIIYLLVLSCEEAAVDVNMEVNQVDKNIQWLEDVKNLFMDKQDVYFHDVIQKLENMGLKVDVVDGGTESGITFFELNVEQKSEVYLIDASGQMRGENQNLVLDSFAVYVGVTVAENNLLYKWEK